MTNRFQKDISICKFGMVMERKKKKSQLEITNGESFPRDEFQQLTASVHKTRCGSNDPDSLGTTDIR